jgi:hypothetical protein
VLPLAISLYHMQTSRRAIIRRFDRIRGERTQADRESS